MCIIPLQSGVRCKVPHNTSVDKSCYVCERYIKIWSPHHPCKWLLMLKLWSRKKARHTLTNIHHTRQQKTEQHTRKTDFFRVNAKEIDREKVKKLREQQHTFIFTMALTPKVCTANQAHAYAGKNDISQISCQEEASSTSSHKEAGARATEKNACPEKEVAFYHLCGQGQRKRGPSRGARPSPWSQTRTFVDGRDEAVFNQRHFFRRDQILSQR